jgi:hypothetical protein
MEWLEANPLPVECENCQEEDCYNCDHAGKRWYLSEEDELRVRRKGLVKAVERLQRQIKEIDRKLLPFTEQQKAALEGQIEMTYDLFWECLQVCFDADNMDRYFEIWDSYPEHIEELKRRSQEEPNKSAAQASWECFKTRMRKEYGEDFI